MTSEEATPTRNRPGCFIEGQDPEDHPSGKLLRQHGEYGSPVGAVAISPASPKKTPKEREAIALRIAQRSGRVITGALASEAGIDRKTAATTLKSLQQQSALEWHGRSAKDPPQFYALTAY